MVSASQTPRYKNAAFLGSAQRLRIYQSVCLTGGMVATYPQLHTAATGTGERSIFNGQEMVDFDQLANDPPELL